MTRPGLKLLCPHLGLRHQGSVHRRSDKLGWAVPVRSEFLCSFEALETLSSASLPREPLGWSYRLGWLFPVTLLSSSITLPPACGLTTGLYVQHQHYQSLRPRLRFFC